MSPTSNPAHTEIEYPLVPLAFNQEYLLYNPGLHDQFYKWWETTQWVKNYHSHPDTSKPYHLPSWSSKRNSIFWNDFNEVIHKTSGKPMVVCQLCQSFLEHPHTKRSGTHGLQIHVKSKQCKTACRGSGQNSVALIAQGNKSVCWSESLYRVTKQC
jgi:hypothetical protein